MPNKLGNRAKMSVSGTPGTGTVTLGSALSGFQSFGTALGNANASVPYLIEEGTSFEAGWGTYTHSGTTLSRDTVKTSSAGGTTKVSFTSAAVASIGLLADDLQRATSAEYLANTSDRTLSTDQVWSAAAEVATSYSATVTLDLSTGINFGPLTLTGNVTLANPSNPKAGQSGHIRILQDSTGSRTITYGTYWKATGGTAGVLTTTASATDVLYYKVLTSTLIHYSLAKDVK